MTNITFEEYCEDILDTHLALMGNKEKEEARASYRKLIASTRSSLSNNALAARDTAKMFGGKALNGTKKQKEWAEKIRAEKLAQMTEREAVMACNPNGILTNAKFWIENRSETGQEIGAFVEKQKALLKEYKAAREASDAEKIKLIADEYNALTAKWGFE